MAAISHSHQIDPSKPAKYRVVISEHLLQEDGPRKRRRVNVQLNHRPKLPASSAESIITPSSQAVDNGYDLSLTNKDNGDVYRYTGVQQPSEALALIYDPKSQAFILDKIDTSFRFNLRSTPNQTATGLATQYPQLDTGLPAPENVEDGLFGEGSANDDEDLGREADPNNPYDYLHFIKPAQQHLSPTPESSPMPNHISNSSPIPVGHPSRPSKSKPRGRALSKSRLVSPNPREEADADNEESENDDPLEIIDDDSKPKNARPSGVYLEGLNKGFRGGSEPRSLRSMASSMSPSVRGGSSDEEKGDRKSNADVEEIDLGDGALECESPGAVEQAAETPGNGWDEESEEDLLEKLLEKELEQELERQAHQDAGHGRVNGTNGVNGMNGTYTNRLVEESSEESEEE